MACQEHSYYNGKCRWCGSELEVNFEPNGKKESLGQVGGGAGRKEAAREAGGADDPEPVSQASHRADPRCERCGGKGTIEVMGDGMTFEWDVVDIIPCGCTKIEHE